ncbi:hypothetical protein [Clostridiisalibacter paucivorans]|uniref:hypothetical protein n=1 Tax=Clostridiisalibacter paucivorans TaxID=408753 RepID=UPI00047C18C1|nr:hypothetical protein [Clostridiisalibacter paucivorans]
MKHEIKKVSKILDELTTFFFTKGAKNIDVSISDQDEYFKISCKVDNIDCSDFRVKKISELLNQPRQPEMEAYYWELTGECDTDTELSLVGMMVDKAEISFKGVSLSIVLYRYK